MVRSLFVGFGLFVLIVLSGCSQGGTNRVTGKVTFNGQPLFKGNISLLPANGRPAHGTIKNGEIVDMTTFTANDGALPGSYKVTIRALSSDDMYTQKSLIHEKYGDPNRSGLTAEIKSGENVLSFNVN